jgi:Acyl-CoA carboxylase epsilon subunit
MSLPPAASLRILRGNPTPEQLAALILALGQATFEDASRAHPQTSTQSSHWQRAARLENLGGAPVTSAADPRLHHQSLRG